MRTICVFILVCIAASSSLYGQTVLRNLIVNYSFEYTGRDTVRASPDEGWIFTPSDPSVAGHVTTSRSLDGFRSFLIRAATGYGIIETEPFEIEPRKRYLLSIWIAGDGTATLSVRWWNEEEHEMTLHESEEFVAVQAADGWRVLEYSVRAPRRVSAASVRVTVSGGQVWIDDVRFR